MAAAKMKMKMCPVCKNLDLEQFTFFPKQGAAKLDIPRAELFDNLQRKCKMCEVIINAIEQARQPTILDRYIPTVQALKYQGGSISLAYVNTRVGSVDPSSRCHIFTIPGSSASQKWPQIGSRAEIDQDALSEQTISRAASWLRDCMEHHIDCGVVAEVELPTRLIKIGGPGEDPKLVITRGMLGKYATLSHCWGAGGRRPPLTTTRVTLDERLAEIPLDVLPRTFRDSITVTRELGLDYLWIDSLCIIQDSPEDWEKECKEMHKIYTNAVINISADSASDSSKGLVRTGDLNADLASSPINGCSGFQMRTQLLPRLDREYLSHCPAVPPNLEEKSLVSFHELRSRAWVLQESMLSRRILRFCNYELVWECDSSVTCECCPQRKDRRLNNIRKVTSEQMARIDTTTPWDKIVHAYSAKKLTFEEDRPNAIAGLAVVASEQSNLTYMSGLWKEQLPVCLLWYKREPGQRTTAHCPTWSWLSLTGQVCLRPEVDGKPSWAVEDYEFVDSEDIRKGGIIRAKGQLAAIIVEEDFGEVYWQPPEGDAICLSGQLLPDVEDWMEFADAETFLLSVLTSENIFYCLILRTVEGLTGRDHDNLNIPDQDAEGQFQRVGFFRYLKDSVDPNIFQETSIVLV